MSLKLIDEKDFVHTGKIDFVDNVIDRSSGTIRGRAVFANPDGIFTPGMFGRLRVPGSPPYAALLVPDAAIGSEQARKYVLVVDDGGVVRQKYVTPGQLDGGLRVIKDGLVATDRVIVNGLMHARPGHQGEGGSRRSRPPAPPKPATRPKPVDARKYMRISHFFIDRPIFAAVVSIVFVILGGVSFSRLPIAQYPEIAPPIINVSGQYPGASADVVAATVVTPIEEQINGVENMLYMSSNSTADGRFSIQVTFDLGTNLDIAQVQVQNRVAIAQPRLPADVRNIGVTVNKASPDLMMVVHLYSPDKSRDSLFISNYATLEVTDPLTRVDGVGSITVFGSRDYSMRIWLDPDRLQSLGLTASDVTNALQAQNIQVASGVLDQPPIAHPGAFQIAVQTLGRLDNPDEFGSIVVKQTPDAVVRLKDVATVELAALDYSSNSYLDHDPAVALAIFQRPGSNALATAKGVNDLMAELAKRFPPGVEYAIVYNPTQFIQQSVDAVIDTIGEAVVLVVLVVILFLQTWRAAIIPLVAIPVSLIGSFFFMAAFGFTLNNLSLFGLVLAIGIVVDDAIVVVENVERNIASGLAPREAARKSMDEVGSALVAIALVLCAVFVPSMFITGISGPVLPAIRADHRRRHRHLADRVADAVAGDVRAVAQAARGRPPRYLVGAADPRLLRLFQSRLRQGRRRHFLAGDAHGAARRHDGGDLSGRHRLRLECVSRRRRSASSRKSTAAISSSWCNCRPARRWRAPTRCSSARSTSRSSVPGVAHAVNVVGFSGATFTNAPNAGALFLVLDPFDKRAPRSAPIGVGDPGRAESRGCRKIQDAFIVAVLPPPVRGIGTAGGFRMMVEDRAGAGPAALRRRRRRLMARANQTPGLARCSTLFETSTPRGLSQYRPHQGAAPRHQCAGRVQRAADLYRLVLRQRLQSVRPHLPRHRAGARRGPAATSPTC